MKFRPPLVIFIFIVSASIVSCKSYNRELQENDFFYFPEKNVYYDVRSSHYYYSLDSSRTWDSLLYKGADIGTALGMKFPVKRPGDLAWSNNDSDRDAFNGVVLNLVNSRTLWLVKQDSLKNIKPVVVAAKAKPAEVKPAEEQEPPKKGIKKFFNKIFGKKKSKKDGE